VLLLELCDGDLMQRLTDYGDSDGDGDGDCNGDGDVDGDLMQHLID
jgi:hypothetical protein